MHSEMLDGTELDSRLDSKYVQLIINLISIFNSIDWLLIGLCLLQNELFPLFLQRHVLKYILGRPIRFHDLAFFDPIVYESLRQLVCEATKSDGNNILANLDLNFV